MVWTGAGPRRRVKLRVAVLLIVAALGVCFVACNVFLGVGRCDSNGDCPDPAKDICDPKAKICVRRPETPPDADTADAGAADGDASSCDLNAPFENLRLVPGLEALAVSSARFSSDEQRVFYSRLAGCTADSCVDLFVAVKSDAGVFEEQGGINRVNAPGISDYWPTLTGDERLIYFESSRSVEKVGGSYVPDLARIWRGVKDTETGEFPERNVEVPPLFTVEAGSEISPYVQPDGLTVYFSSTARGNGTTNFDIYAAEIDRQNFGNPKSITNVSAINTPRAELHPVVTRDNRTLYFARESGPRTIRDIYVSKRKAGNALAMFEPDTPVAELNTEYEDFPSWISDDECRIYFTSDRPVGDAGPPDAGSGAHLWMANRPAPGKVPR